MIHLIMAVLLTVLLLYVAALYESTALVFLAFLLAGLVQASVFIGHDGHRGAEESLELVLALVQRLGIAAGGHLTEKALEKF